MRPNKQYLLVRIDMQQQKAKREKTKGGIYIPENYQYMKYNLQYGEIVAIGERVHQQFPEAQVGDTAIFHHFVESQEKWVVGKEPNGDELRLVWVDDHLIAFHLYGVIKKDGDLIPFPLYIFLEPETKTIKEKYISTLLIEENKLWEDDDYLLGLLDKLKHEMAWLSESFSGLDRERDWKKIDDINKRLLQLSNEQRRISMFMNKFSLAKAQVMFVHPQTERECSIKPGTDHVVSKKELYPIYFAGNEFKIAKKENVFAIYS